MNGIKGKPPSINATRPFLFRLRMNEIGSKSNAFKGIVNGWNSNNDQLMFSSYNDLVYAINELGKPVDDARFLLTKKIADGCEKYKLPEC